MLHSLTINGASSSAAMGTSLFEAARDLGIAVPTSCRTQGKCKECIVEIVEGIDSLTPRGEAEIHLTGSFRLSCQARIAGPGAIRCHTMRRGRMRVERSALNLTRSVSFDPAVTRRGESICIDGEEVERSVGPIHGIAMDLGTTTVVLRLLDMESGKQVADTCFENPQRFGGSDVMARIAYDDEHRGLLMCTLSGYLAHAIESFPIDPRTIYEMVIVGNSTMRDLFFGQSVHSIGQNPYRSITELEMAEGKRKTTALVSTGRRCLLPVHPRARIYGAPVISGHLGADAAVCMMAVDMASEDRLVAIMDVGTNTELILGNRERIVAASFPAGPAFEGGSISCGMPALDGAIEQVAIEEDGKFRLGVVGGGPPEGICGSGLVDLMSELLRTGRMNVMGRFEDERRIALDSRVGLLESDVNELAQAKAANVAGLQVVASCYGVEFDDIEVFYLAGAFGRHMNVESAQRIGLIPAIPQCRFVQVGNAAVEGATIALLSRSCRRELEESVRRVEHCRLETHPDFFNFFVEGCQFKPVGAA